MFLNWSGFCFGFFLYLKNLLTLHEGWSWCLHVLFIRLFLGHKKQVYTFSRFFVHTLSKVKKVVRGAHLAIHFKYSVVLQFNWIEVLTKCFPIRCQQCQLCVLRENSIPSVNWSLIKQKSTYLFYNQSKSQGRCSCRCSHPKLWPPCRGMVEMILIPNFQIPRTQKTRSMYKGVKHKLSRLKQFRFCLLKYLLRKSHS